MPTRALQVIATRSPLLVKSGFSGYDAALNPYVGCEFGCSYCYVRFFVKDQEREWGEFVRVRAHMTERLPVELRRGRITTAKDTTTAIEDCRLVLGTMTDPYQPAEKKHGITRTALEILLRSESPKFEKVGIFTRSPLVLRDIELIKQLPRPRVHFTITPFAPGLMRALEPYAPVTERRWQTIAALQQAGIRTHVNVAPVMPGMSEELIPEFAKRLAELGVAEYFVDPMQPYKESFASFRDACAGQNVDWAKIESIMLDKEKYLTWKGEYLELWQTERRKWEHLCPDQLPIWSDHEHHTWVDMRTGESMSKRRYGDDLDA